MNTTLPPESSHESRRQEALHRYRILDSPPEESFDRITRLAAQLFDVPVALVSLVDKDRQWHKSCYGFDIREIERETSFCAHNLLGDEVMVVEDAMQDERFASNPVVTAEPNIRFYAGAPLRTHDGYTLGSLCVIDQEPRLFGARERAQLRDLAAMVTDELELRREVHSRKEVETIQSGQNHILEQMVGRAPLSEVLAAAVQFIERMIPDARAAIMLLDQETQTIQTSAAPHLPESFVKAAKGAVMGPDTGMGARAAFRNTDVLTHDLLDDPHWEGVRDLAHEYDVRACWSIPICGEGDTVWGVFSLYFSSPYSPSETERQFVRQGARMAGIAVERTHARQSLRTSEERFRSLVSNLPGLVYRRQYDAVWTTLYMSRGYDAIAGYPVGVFEQGKRSFKEIVVPEDLPVIREVVREAVDARSHYEVEYRIRARDGSIRWIQDVARPCFDPDGRVKWLDGVMFDVTERKQTEERLRLLETAVNDATESVLITDGELDLPGPQVVYANPGFEKMTGYRAEEMIGKTPRLLQGPDTDYALMAELRRLLEAGDSFFGETINYRKDGTPFVNEWSISPVRNEYDAITHYVAVQRDITERKEMEEQLLKIRTAVENMSSAVGISDAKGRPLYLNAAAKQLLGYTVDGLDAAGGPSVIFADPAVGDAILASLQAGTPWQGEARIVSKNGRTFPAMLRADAVTNEEGTVVGAVASINDISERRRLENQLARYFDMTLDMLCFVDQEGVIQRVNRQFWEALGYEGGDAIRGHSFREFLHPEDRQAGESAMNQLVDGRGLTDFVNRWRHRDGSYRLLEWRAVASAEGTTYAAARDVTERKKAEAELVRYAEQLQRTTAALEEAKARTDRILASITDAFFTLNHKWAFTFLNEQAERLLEHSADAITGESIWATFPDALGTVFQEQFEQAAADGEAVQFEAFYPAHSRWYRVHAYPFEDGLSVFFSDVTDKKRAERALRESEEKYRTVVENVKDVVFRTDAEGRLTFLNPAWEEATGYPIDAALGQSIGAFVHEGDDDTDWSEFEVMLAGRKDFCRYEVQFKSADDVPRWMEVFARPMRNEDGTLVGTSGTLHDVSKWREAEEQMRKALTKERELGRLKSRFVSMASHELRTPLATIQSSAELADLFMRRGNEEKTTKHLNRIQSNVGRMATLLEDVLVFGRAESGRLPFDPIPMDLAGLAVELIDDIRQGIGSAHTVKASGLDGEVALEADPQLLRLVLTNLLSNAVKYSSEGSTVRLQVESTDEHVHIVVDDEGIGIPREDLDRLFEPFHRAENVGTASGTGLGLAILKEATDLHQGTVQVRSTEGEGSTFQVTLPRVRSADDPTRTRETRTSNEEV